MGSDELISIGPRRVAFTNLIEAFNFAYKSALLSYRYHRTLARNLYSDRDDCVALYNEATEMYVAFGQAIVYQNLPFLGPSYTDIHLDVIRSI